MNEEILKQMEESELKVLREAISILEKAGVTGDLKTAKETLEKYFAGKKPYPYPYPAKEVKKSGNFYWPTAERQIYGYNQDDLAMIKDSDIDEIEKSDENEKWPSLTTRLNLGKQRTSDYLDEIEIEERFI